MKRILVLTILIIWLLASCAYDHYPPEQRPVSITSESVFVVNGKAYTLYANRIPITIYNPNNYAITVTADGIDYVIAPLATLELKEDEAK